MPKKKVKILGEAWTLDICPKEKYESLKNGRAGFCDSTVRLMAVDDFTTLEPSPHVLRDLHVSLRSIIRHEMLHAFLAESGLMGESQWAEDEEMIDWFANQLPKIVEAMKQVGAL